MPTSVFQQALHEYRTALKVCGHESDYAVLYNCTGRGGGA